MSIPKLSAPNFIANLNDTSKLYILIFVILALAIVIAFIDSEARKKRKLQKRMLEEQRSQIIGKKTGRIERYVTDEKKLMTVSKTDTKTYIFLLVASMVLGLLLGKLIYTDTLLAFVVAVFCIVLPHAILVIKLNKDNISSSENLESSMRIITHEYISCLDIEKAVQNSVDVIDHNKPFTEFLVDCKMVSNNIERNLRKLEAKENNTFFSRWIDQLILVQSDRTQIVNLMPILDDMNDAKTAQHQNDTKVASAWRDYFIMLFIILLSPLLIRFIQYEWYSYLITTPIGKLLVVLMLASLVWSTFKAMKINKPITG